MRVLILLAALLLSGCGGSSHHSNPPPVVTPNQSAWSIGPIIKGTNHSVGMPLHPTIQGEGWYFDFPNANGKVDYVQWFSPPSLVGAKAITIHFTVSGGGFHPYEKPDSDALVGIEFQRYGDNWTGVGAMQSFRWYSHAKLKLEAGEFTLSAPLTLENWGDVYGKNDNQAAFDAAILNLSNISITLGHSSGAGHGVYTTEPSRFTLTKIEVER